MVVCRGIRGGGGERQGGGGGQAGQKPGPDQGSVPVVRAVGPSRVGGAVRGPSPETARAGCSRARSGARARALRVRAGLGAYLGRPARPGGQGLRVQAARGGLFRDAHSPSSRDGSSGSGSGSSGSSGSGRLSLRLPLRESPRRRGRRRQAARGGPAERAASGSARAAGAVTATPRVEGGRGPA